MKTKRRFDVMAAELVRLRKEMREESRQWRRESKQREIESRSTIAVLEKQQEVLMQHHRALESLLNGRC